VRRAASLDPSPIDPFPGNLTAGQAAAAARKGRRLRDLIDDALDVEPDQRRYSVRDLRAFQIGLPLYRAAHATAEAHQATAALRRMLEHLARGCHRFDCAAKLDAYRAARDEASLAVCELILQPVEDADRLISAIEQDLLAALAGALRRVERQGQRRPGGRDRGPP
jgi:hypothetical protein